MFRRVYALPRVLSSATVLRYRSDGGSQTADRFMKGQESPLSATDVSSTVTDIDFDRDASIDRRLIEALAALEGRAPLLAGMARYHLGFSDQDMAPVALGSSGQGKRIRPAVAVLAAAAAGGDPSAAAPVGAALELLHNFTLIHDDVQDESRSRRHRPTVWSIWGVGQAINAGDALFAAAHLPFYRLPDEGVPPALALRLLEAFDRMTIAIVEGQTLDLGFETRNDVTPANYLEMIAGKTAAIVRYAAWAGALLGGADEDAAERWSEFGLALGLGFQIQDDLLGVWGIPGETGKAAADDIRRRKQSFPIVLLRQRLGPIERIELDRLYAQPEVDAPGVSRVLALLAAHRVRADVESEAARYHDEAYAALQAAAPEANPARDRLHTLVERLAIRAS